jgi:hypothetical protein
MEALPGEIGFPAIYDVENLSGCDCTAGVLACGFWWRLAAIFAIKHVAAYK